MIIFHQHQPIACSFGEGLLNPPVTGTRDEYLIRFEFFGGAQHALSNGLRCLLFFSCVIKRIIKYLLPLRTAGIAEVAHGRKKHNKSFFMLSGSGFLNGFRHDDCVMFGVKVTENLRHWIELVTTNDDEPLHYISLPDWVGSSDCPLIS